MNLGFGFTLAELARACRHLAHAGRRRPPDPPSLEIHPMNVFYIDGNPNEAARALCDRHLMAQIGDVQVLGAAALLLRDVSESTIRDAKLPNPRVASQHPIAIWASTSDSAFSWLVVYLGELLAEHAHRFEVPHDDTGAEARLAELSGRGNARYLAFVAPPAAPPVMGAAAVAARRDHPDGDAVSWNRIAYAYRIRQWERDELVPKWTRRARPAWLPPAASDS